MKRLTITLVALIAVAATLGAFALQSGGTTQAAGPPDPPQVVSGFGVSTVNGQPAYLHITVAVPAGVDPDEALENAIRQQGARPADFSAFSTLPLEWKQFFDDNDGNDSVLQVYYAGTPQTGGVDPTGNQGHALIQSAQATWTDVDDSRFAFDEALPSGGCPSLFLECGGEQTISESNEVGWLLLDFELNDGLVLAATWIARWRWIGPAKLVGLDTDWHWEADVALNTFGILEDESWTTDASLASTIPCDVVENACVFDAETVFLHEEGHVVGLGHTDVEIEDGYGLPVLYPRYHGVRRVLHQDDKDGVSFLYPYPADDGGNGGGNGNGGCNLNRPNCPGR